MSKRKGFLSMARSSLVFSKKVRGSRTAEFFSNSDWKIFRNRARKRAFKGVLQVFLGGEPFLLTYLFLVSTFCRSSLSASSAECLIKFTLNSCKKKLKSSFWRAKLIRRWKSKDSETFKCSNRRLIRVESFSLSSYTVTKYQNILLPLFVAFKKLLFIRLL